MSEAIPPLPQHAFMTWCSVKAQGSTLPLLLYYADINNFCSKLLYIQQRVFARVTWTFIMLRRMKLAARITEVSSKSVKTCQNIMKNSFRPLHKASLKMN